MRNKLNIFILVLVIFFTSNSVYAHEITKEEIENSTYFIDNRAEIKYIKAGNDLIREVYIKGFRLKDRELLPFIKDQILLEKINNEIKKQSYWYSGIMGLGLPLGVLLLYLASLERNAILALPIDKRPLSVDFKTFIFGTVGSVVFLYSVINVITFFNELTGLSEQKLLKNEEVEGIIKNYNNELINYMLKHSINNNSNINNLSYSNNNIMIINISSSF